MLLLIAVPAFAQNIVASRSIKFDSYLYSLWGNRPLSSIAQTGDNSYIIIQDLDWEEYNDNNVLNGIHCFVEGNSTGLIESLGMTNGTISPLFVVSDLERGISYVLDNSNRVNIIDNSSYSLLSSFGGFNNSHIPEYLQEMEIDNSGNIYLLLDGDIYYRSEGALHAQQILSDNEIYDIEIDNVNNLVALSTDGSIEKFVNDGWEYAFEDVTNEIRSVRDFEFMPNGDIVLLAESTANNSINMYFISVEQNSITDIVNIDNLFEDSNVWHYPFEERLLMKVDNKGVVWLYFEEIIITGSSGTNTSTIYAYYGGEWYGLREGETSDFPNLSNSNNYRRCREIIVNNEDKIVLPVFEKASPNFPITIYEFELDGIVSSSEPLKEEYEVSIYPNPASEEIYIQLNSEVSEVDDITYTLFDATGKEVYSESKLLGNELVHKIDIQEQPSGIYFLQITSPKDNKSKYEKVIIH